MRAMPSKSPLFTIFLVVFFDLLSFGIVIPILPYYSKTFGANAFELGWLMAAYSIAQFFCAPLWGSLSDRLGRRPVLLGTILGGALMMAATAVAPSYRVLLMARILAGVFGANISTASAYIADVTTEENRAKGMGVIGAGFGLGFIFGPALGGLLSTHGYQLPILLAAGLGIANFFFAYFVLREPERHSVPATRSRAAGVGAAFSQSRTGIPIGLFFLHTLSFTHLEVAFGLFVLARYNLGAREAGAFLAGMGLVSAALQGGMIGKLAKRFGELNLLPIAFLSLALGMAGAAFAGSPAVFGLCLFFVALGMGISNPCLSSLTSKAAPSAEQGAVLGVYQSAGSLARVIGPPAAGFLFDRLGPSSPLLVASGIVAFALLALLSVRSRLA